MKDRIVESVVEQFQKRSEVGMNKYGTNLERKDLSIYEWLSHAQEESMDLCLYLERLKQDIKKIEDILKGNKEPEFKIASGVTTSSTPGIVKNSNEKILEYRISGKGTFRGIDNTESFPTAEIKEENRGRLFIFES
jgi:hypothetical protein